MVSSGQGDETGVRDAGDQLAPGLESNDQVVLHVHHKRRRLHLGEKIGDLETVGEIEIAAGHSEEVVFRCSSLKWSACSCVSSGKRIAWRTFVESLDFRAHPKRIKVDIASAFFSQLERVSFRRARNSPYRIRCDTRFGRRTAYPRRRRRLRIFRGAGSAPRRRHRRPSQGLSPRRRARAYRRSRRTGHCPRVVTNQRVLARQPAKDMAPNWAFPNRIQDG